ncbi:MAG TPA: extracellular solute-binding protein [Rhodanobacteraceae bacterium]
MKSMLLGLVAVLVLVAALPSAAAPPPLRVDYAGSMGAVMDLGLAPVFAKAHKVRYQGIGQGSYALAHLLISGQRRADVFVTITPGPMRLLQKAGLVDRAVPIASTRMVVIYSPKSRFVAAFRAAAAGTGQWYDVLRRPGLRFGRTDPSLDPQGANVLLTLRLASMYYHQPALLRQVAGTGRNVQQIFTETSLLSRLEAGEIDATIGYYSAARSHHLPTIALPAEVDLADPALQATWYARADYRLADGHPLRAEPLVFYAAVLKNAPDPRLGHAYVDFLTGPQGQQILHRYGYGKPHGGDLTGVR